MEDEPVKTILEFELPNVKDTIKKIDELTLSMEELRSKTKENAAENKLLAKENAKLKDKVSDLNRNRRDEVKLLDIQRGSLGELRKKVSLLFKERDKLDRQSVEGKKRFDELSKEIKGYREEIQLADKSAGVFTSSIGNYAAGMKEAITLTGLMSSPLGKLYSSIIFVKKALEEKKKAQQASTAAAAVHKTETEAVTGATIASRVATSGLTNGLKLFKIALVSTGVGALLVALGSLVTFLTKTEKGMEFVSRVMSSTGAVVDVVVNRVSLLGEALFKLISGDFEGAWETAKKVVSGFGDELVSETTKAWELEAAYQALEDRQIEYILEKAKTENEISELRYKAKDLENKNNSLALKYIKQADELTKKLLITELELAKEEARISEERLNLGERTDDKIKETNELKAKVFELETKRNDELRSIAAAEVALNNKLATDAKKALEEKKKAAEERAKIEKEEFDKSVELAVQKEDQRLEAVGREKELLEEMDAFDDQLREEELEKEEEHAQKRLEIEERYQNEMQKLQDNSLSTIFKLIDQNYGKQENRVIKSYDKKQKALEDDLKNGIITQEQYDEKSKELEKKKAHDLYKIELAKFRTQRIADLSRVVIDTARAVTKSIAESPLTFGLPWSAFAAAEGVLQGAVIMNQPEPSAPQLKEGGIILNGKSHSKGGIKFVGDNGQRFEAEGGEGVFVTKREATKNILSRINEKYGGRSFRNLGTFMKEGGRVDIESQLSNLDLLNAISNLRPIVLVEDIQTGINLRGKITSVGVIS